MSQTKLRNDNRRNVLRTLVEKGPTSRSVLAKHLDLTQASISRIVRGLIVAGVLDEGETITSEGRPGRRNIEVGFAANKLFVVGLGFEAFSQSLVIADLNGAVVQYRNLGIVNFDDPDVVLKSVVQSIFDMLAEAGIAKDRLIGIGASFVGTVDRIKGKVVYAQPLGWTNVPVSQILKRLMGVPVIVDNLLHSTNLVEHAFGVSKGRSEVLLVRGSLSVGASMIVNNQIVRGAQSKAGQIAHLPIAGPDDELCICGARGCLETKASGRAMLARVEEREFTSFNNADAGALSAHLARFLDAADKGEARHLQILEEGGRILGEWLKGPITILNSQCLVLSGPVARHPAYVRGVLKGLQGFFADEKSLEGFVVVSHMSMHAVAVRLAITEFLMVRDLDLAPLMRADSRARSGEEATDKPEADEDADNRDDGRPTMIMA